MDRVMVSICCVTYNHEKYIAEAIESFLMQDTNFDYEILIHDDASTDKTAEIIKEYQNRYPNIIKPICQVENQYSKGVKVSQLNRERAKGKYIALCEGDDYWTDKTKLQKQVDFMEKNNEFSLCVHAGEKVNNKGKRIYPMRPYQSDRVCTTSEVILGGGDMFPTNSMFFKKQHTETMPKFYSISPVGDYPLVIYLSLVGKVYYFDKIMSAYRVGVAGSWNNRVSSNVDKATEHYYSMKKVMHELNLYTNKIYENEILEVNNRGKLNILCMNRKYKEIKNGELKDYYKKLHYCKKIGTYIRCKAPKQYITIRNLLRKFNYGKIKQK